MSITSSEIKNAHQESISAKEESGKVTRSHVQICLPNSPCSSACSGSDTKAMKIVNLGEWAIAAHGMYKSHQFNWFLCKTPQRNYHYPSKIQNFLYFSNFKNRTIYTCQLNSTCKEIQNCATQPLTHFLLPLTKLLHTLLRSIFSLCTSTNFWKTTCQNLPHFHSYSQWSYHCDTIQCHQFQ
jgi:hypothetical protein